MCLHIFVCLYIRLHVFMGVYVYTLEAHKINDKFNKAQILVGSFDLFFKNLGVKLMVSL